MKKLGVLLFLALCPLFALVPEAWGVWINVGDNAGVDVQVLESSPQRIALQFTVGGFDKSDVLIDGQTYSKIGLPGEGLHLEEGLPELPSIARSVIIPDDRQMQLRVVSSEFVDLPGIDVVPSKGDLPRTVDPDQVPYRFDSFYHGGGVYPAEQAFTREPYILRDYRGMTVVANPMQYLPSTHTLRVYTRLTVELLDVGAGGLNVIERTSGPNALTPEFEQIYQGHFLNFNQQDRYTMVSEVGSMLVICYDDFASAMQPYVEWKNQMGVPTELVLKSQVGTTSAQVKSYIQSYYDASSDPKLTFVLLVGDAAQIPTPSSDGGAADPTYSKLAGSDNYPDIFVGRFSAENVTQVDTQVLRTIDYEKNPLLAGDAWYPKGTGIASNQGPGDDGEYDYQHVGNIRTQLLGYGYTFIDEIYDPNANATMVANALNEGRSIINYCGHGSVNAWSSSGFSSSNVNALVNDHMLPFIFSVACVNGQFNTGTCFAEAWLRATHNGVPTGAVATYMSSINQSWNPPMQCEDEVARLMITDSARTYGSLCFHGSCSMMDQYGAGGVSMFNTWHIFGDPSVRIRTKTTQPLTVEAPTNIAPDATSFELDVPGVEDALCALSYQGEYLGSGFTNSSGHAVILVTGALPEGEAIDLTVTGYNRVPSFGSVLVAPLAMPEIQCDPESFEISVPYDSQTEEYLTISNIGEPESMLNFAAFFQSEVVIPWLVINPNQGSIPAGESEVLTLSISTTGLHEGDYDGQIILNYTPSRTMGIPVILHVGENTAVGPGRGLVREVALEMAGPNPAQGPALLRYALPRAQEATLAVFDAGGRLVRTLRQGNAGAGEHLVSWDGRDASGRFLPGGLYFARLTSEERTLSLRVMRLE